MRHIVNKILWFIKDYLSRHVDNANRVLHIAGVPQAFYGIFQLVTGRFGWGLFNLACGYFLQWLGHTKFEKNEVGEVILIKHLIKKFFRR